MNTITIVLYITKYPNEPDSKHEQDLLNNLGK